MASTDSWLIVGPGLPSPTYAGNRHNVGAMVIDEMAAPSAEALEAELAEAEAEAGIEREEHGEAAEGAGEGDVVPEPQDQGSGESMDSAEQSAQND